MNTSNLKQQTQDNLQDEIMGFISSRKSLLLSSLDANGHPFASYAPFAIGDQCLYVLLSDVAQHAINLKLNRQASVLIIEDEDTADELFARLRVSYRIKATEIDHAAGDTYRIGIDALRDRHGERIDNLSELGDFHLFHLQPVIGRYVKGFGRAYEIQGESLSGKGISHLRDGHVKRPAA